MDPLKILLLDNDPETLALLQEKFRRGEDRICPCRDVAEMSHILSKEMPDVLVLSTEWVDDPIGPLERLKREWEDLPVIFVSRKNSVPLVVEAMKKGARDFFLKPLARSGIEKAILQAAKESRLLRRVNQFQGLMERQGRCDDLIGVGYPMQRIYRMIDSVAHGDATVLITGESGVGKELVAKAIHRRGQRQKHPFVAVNCASIPRELLESELFGYERGAFTGANRRHLGCCETANRGTLFLDEICETGFDLQAKLLRFLQERNFRPLGSDRVVEVDTRVICATNRDPQAEVKAGRFREDLFYRISVIPIEVPPLRERKEDVPILAMKFLEEFSSKYEKYFYDFSAEAMERIVEFPWPGNVRELRNTVEQIVALNTGSQVIERFLPEKMRKDRAAGAGEKPGLESDPGDGGRRILRIEELEKHAILQALKVCHGNIGEAARRLGLGQATLYRKIKRYEEVNQEEPVIRH
jgi:DNA-binding NtrC family response regulator